MKEVIECIKQYIMNVQQKSRDEESEKYGVKHVYAEPTLSKSSLILFVITVLIIFSILRAIYNWFI